MDDGEKFGLDLRVQPLIALAAVDIVIPVPTFVGTGMTLEGVWEKSLIREAKGRVWGIKFF